MISIIFYPFGNSRAISSFNETGEAIKEVMTSVPEERIFIHTEQMCFLTDAWDLELDIWIVNKEAIPMSIQNIIETMDKEIRPSHNLFRLWRAGAFGNDLI